MAISRRIVLKGLGTVGATEVDGLKVAGKAVEVRFVEEPIGVRF